MTSLTQTPFDTDVLIVGAGPTGLTLATYLARAGVSTIIVDRLATGQNTSRAAVIHAHTLEELGAVGVTERLEREGLKVQRFTLRDRDRRLVSLSFGQLPSAHSHLLMLTQEVTERILREQLADSGRQVRWSCAVEALRETAEGVEAIVVTPEGRGIIRARYVVGADGVNSLVRKSAGIGFSGESYEDSFVLADVNMEWSHGGDEVSLFFSPEGMLVVAPLPGGRFRLVATLDDAPEKPGIRDIQALLDARAPTRGAARVSVVHWSSRFRLHHRVADQYRRGRFLLVGDAAHAHSPAGGQGMNTGIVDAVVLGKLLARVLKDGAAQSQLDHYEALRRPAAQQVLGLAGRLTKMATVKGRMARRLRNVLLGVMGRIPAMRRKLQLELSGLARRALAEVPAA